MPQYDKAVIECRVKKLGVEPQYIADGGVEGSPVIAIEQKAFFDEKGIEVRFCGACPVIMCRQNRKDCIEKKGCQYEYNDDTPVFFQK